MSQGQWAACGQQQITVRFLFSPINPSAMIGDENPLLILREQKPFI
jgi:hypothetical protein